MKRILSLLLAVVMVFAMSAVTFAANPTPDNRGSITIDNAKVGETYTIYQILYLESYNKETGTYAYKATDKWADFINSADIKGTYVNVDGKGYVTWVKDADPAEFAKLAKAYAKEKGIADDGSKLADTTTVTFENLNLGYYLVDTTHGSLCSLNTTKPDVTIKDKNEEPLIDKEVQEDSTGAWGDHNDADIGDTVNFKTTVTIKKGAVNYVVHDTLTHLTLDKTSIKVFGPDGKPLDNSGARKYYTVSTPGSKDGCSFEVAFEQWYLDDITEGITKDDAITITITYSATLNENAVVGDKGNPNTTHLTYGDNSKTEEKTTKTYTWDMKILKYGNGDEATKLKGAQFILLNSDKSKAAQFDAKGKFTGWVDLDKGTELTTGEDGTIHIEGLDSGKYWLRETQAPENYNKLLYDVEVEIKPGTNDAGKITYTTVTAKINNQTGTELPGTGAEGTMMFITFGLILTMAAVVFLVTRKKMSIYRD